MTEWVRNEHRGAVLRWLAVVCVLVVAMLVVGGVTRLTGSGLSIVEWRPITGILPPLTDDDWQRAFTAYQGSPEYRLVNAGMTLADFRRIFLWEYGHRLLGRLLGLYFFVPFAYFIVKRAFAPALLRRLALGFGLGAMQGVLGWLMVASGLVDVPHVSHYRLAAHLSLALIVLGYFFWIWMDLRGPRQIARPRLRLVLRVALGLLGAQIVYGAFTAGLHAGIGYNTFPTMHGRWVPPEAFALAPPWRNLVENPATVQLVHRALGVALVIAVVAVAVLARSAPATVRRAVHLVVGACAAQFALGVATLVLVVPIGVAAVHQLGACLLLLATLRAMHAAGPEEPA